MAKNSKPGVMIYFDMFVGMKKLDYGQKGMLFEAIMEYSQTGQEPKFDDFACDVAWDFIRPRLDSDSKRYEDVVEVRKAAAEARWEKEKDADAKNANASDDVQKHAEPCKCIPADAEEASASPTPAEDKRSSKRFAPPTAEDVASYARETGRTIDAQRFVDFYSAKGWKVGSSPMKDWKAAVRNWCARDSAPAARQGPKVTVHQQYNQRDYTHDDSAADALMGGML